MSNFGQEGIERYCPVCDAHDIFVTLERTDSKDNGTSVECPKCGYKRNYSKDEVASI